MSPCCHLSRLAGYSLPFGSLPSAASIETPFVTFGLAHVIATIFIISISLGLPILTAGFASPKQQSCIGKGVAVLLVSHVVANAWVRAAIYDQPLYHHLPLHLCGASIILSTIVLLFHSYRAFEVTYYWALGGAIPAIAMPDVSYTFPHPFFLLFFSGHLLELTGVTFAMIVLGFRPRPGSVVRAIVATAAYASLIMPLNYLLDSNYMYLRHKPVQATLIDYLGPWPFYIISLAFIAVVVAVVLYAPFAKPSNPDRSHN